MDFQTLKNKFLRKLHSFHIGTLGAIVCSAQLLLELYSFAIQLFMLDGINNISSIIFLAINCIFDLYLVKYFITSKENNSLQPARIAIIFLIISNYVLPAIQIGIESLFSNALGQALFGIILSGLVFGIAYFVLLILENKRKGKHNLLFMTIIGAIMVLLALGQGGLAIANGILLLMEPTDILYDALMFIYYLLNGFVIIGMSVIFLLYPVFEIRERRRGY